MPVCVDGPCSKRTIELFARSPAQARPAVRDLRTHTYSGGLLRDRIAPNSGPRFYRVLVEDGHRRTVAKRADLVPLGLVRVRPGCKRPLQPLIVASRSAH